MWLQLLWMSRLERKGLFRWVMRMNWLKPATIYSLKFRPSRIRYTRESTVIYLISSISVSSYRSKTWSNTFLFSSMISTYSNTIALMIGLYKTWFFTCINGNSIRIQSLLIISNTSSSFLRCFMKKVNAENILNQKFNSQLCLPLKHFRYNIRWRSQILFRLSRYLR